MMLATRFLCVAVLAAVASAENFTWLGLSVDTTASSEPPARHSAAMGSWNNQFYVFGGIGNVHNGSRLFGMGRLTRTSVDPALVRWEVLSVSRGPAPRYGMVYGVYQQYLIISHGRGESNGQLYDDTWAFDMDEHKWLEVNVSLSLGVNETGKPPVPEARIDAAGGVWDNLLWLSMGRNKDKRTLSDLWVLTFNTTRENGALEIVGEWEMLDEGVGYNQYDLFLPHARYKHTGAPLSNTSFVFFGGCASGGYVGGPCPLGDSWVYNREEEEWTKLEDCSSPVNDGAMISLSENRGVLLFGDEEDGPGAYPQLLSARPFNTSDLSVVDAENETWVVTRGRGGAFPSKRSDPTIAKNGDSILIYGGRNVDDEDQVYSDLWLLTWTREDGEPRSCPDNYFSFVHLHGVLMYIAWGLLLPLGALLGRYYRQYWPFWFILHIICHSLGLLLTVAGFVLIFLVGSYDEPNFAHAIVGIVLTVILIHQFLNGIFHPCVDRENGQTPKEDKSVYRRCWEIYHATSGFLTIAIGLGQVTLGVFLVVAPFEVWVTWCALGLAWVATFFIHEVVFLIYKIYSRVGKNKIER